jgi:riboflavin kinase/FMN adenylyltransferase
MKIIDYNDQIDRQSAVTIGNFDGVHRGHQTLIRELVRRAHEKNLSSVLLTFDPHTRSILYPDLPQSLLTTFDEKAKLIELLGVDYLMKIPFTKEFSDISPEQFLEEVLIKKLHTAEWVMGEGHTIGRERQGGKKFLHNAMDKYHINIFTAELLARNETVVSSTEIRKLVIEGRVAEALEMLGHPYLISAERVSGLKIGSQLGYPTLNFRRPPSQKVIPPPGVYAAELEFEGIVQPGALYFGDCPTFSNRDVHFEFHSLNLSGKQPEINQKALIWLYKYIREDKVFNEADALVNQIRTDVEKIKLYFMEEKRTWR